MPLFREQAAEPRAMLISLFIGLKTFMAWRMSFLLTRELIQSAWAYWGSAVVATTPMTHLALSGILDGKSVQMLASTLG
ncbi:MAG: hypothetical protein H6Q65_954 [Firmicutes bacterium]|nr:hypothetical protein [Bacillota bacterium]